jgi:predicted dinucleotide-binding enzyme
LRIGVLRTGAVGRAIAGKLIALGHDVVIGTRDVRKTMAHAEPDYMGNPPFSVWHKTHDKARLATFSEAATHGELIVNATSGAASLDALKLESKGFAMSIRIFPARLLSPAPMFTFRIAR